MRIHIIKQKLKLLINKIKQLPLWITIPATAVFLGLFVCILVFIQEKPVNFSYGGGNCAQHLTFLPDLTESSGKLSDYTVENKDPVKIWGMSIFSQKTCFVAKKAPSTGEIRMGVGYFGGWFVKKTFKLTVPKPPVARLEVLAKPISTIKPLVLRLSGSDLIFSYQIEVAEKVAKCPIKDLAIYCDIASLSLSQGTNYDVKLVRLFKGQKVATLTTKSVKTLDATTVVSASVGQDQVIYDKPKAFTFEFDKDVVKSDVKLEKVEGDKRTAVNTTTVFSGKQATANLGGDLDRDALYEFTIDQLEAKDGSTLMVPYKLGFKVSDGPSVTGIDADGYGQPLAQTLTLTFDQSLLDGQDIAKFVSISGVAASISKSGNHVYISYVGAPLCADLTIRVDPGLQSTDSIIQNDPWVFSTRTVCHTTSVIGYSKDGRAIVAYIFGSGGTTILYTGSIHGSELSAKYLMDAWVGELEANARSIPADKKIVVIPTLNPDGIAANRRYNSNGVDLNRNFPTSDWQTDITTTSNQPLPSGGGASALSEPESQAIAAFTTQLSPRLTMSFHSAAGYTIGNQAGDSVALAATYSQMVGYRNMTGVDGAFSYPITGTYDDWMREKCGLTSVLIELSSSYNSEFYKNKTALWAMARS